ncbi:site-specific integrase [Parasedimentitalea marina]|uniref:Site-specific integrase n=1 Tax=Parasedimentitalea marina TaxID=2483033 RepID=A0A3T0N7B3_9RHOB|nr:tyrosine-type recombinase/integrase [Parasedimentitalea marina]AZV79887.1 site-specific integrase [Parasedimentitalea marina]
MPLEVYPRGSKWWVKGRVEYEGLPITGYYRRSTGSSSKQGAVEWIQIETDRQRRRHLLGEEAEQLTMGAAIQIYNAKPTELKALIRVVKALSDEFCRQPVASITGKYLRDLGYTLKPNVATDTMWREVVTPIRAVINNAHDLGKCPPIRVKRYSEKERIDQDILRGKQSRMERKPADRQWIEKFCEHADIYNAALVRFMFETAARIDQAISLTPNDLDLVSRKVFLKAAKGHQAQWVAISQGMMVELANLPPKRPHNRKLGCKMEPRVFGYGSSTGYNSRWKTICRAAGIPYISAHPAGRHGFYTELRVNQGADPVTAAAAGRWKSVSLQDQIYAHVKADEAEIREQIRTGHVQRNTTNSPK